jgi:hypothetical protein
LSKVLSKYTIVVRRRLDWMRKNKRGRDKNPALLRTPDQVSIA